MKIESTEDVCVRLEKDFSEYKSFTSGFSHKREDNFSCDVWRKIDGARGLVLMEDNTKPQAGDLVIIRDGKATIHGRISRISGNVVRISVPKTIMMQNLLIPDEEMYSSHLPFSHTSVVVYGDNIPDNWVVPDDSVCYNFGDMPRSWGEEKERRKS